MKTQYFIIMKDAQEIEAKFSVIFSNYRNLKYIWPFLGLKINFQWSYRRNDVQDTCENYYAYINI